MSHICLPKTEQPRLLPFGFLSGCRVFYSWQLAFEFFVYDVADTGIRPDVEAGLNHVDYSVNRQDHAHEVNRDAHG